MDVRQQLPEFASKMLIAIITDDNLAVRYPHLYDHLTYITHTSITCQAAIEPVHTASIARAKDIAEVRGLASCLFVRPGVFFKDLRKFLWWIDEAKIKAADAGSFWFSELPATGEDAVQVDYTEHAFFADPKRHTWELGNAFYDHFRSEVLTTGQIDFLDCVERQRQQFLSRVYFTDGEDPLVEMDPKQLDTQHYYGVPSSFKLEYLTHLYGLKSGATVTYLDVSAPALKYRRALIERWDGSNYADFAFKYATDNCLEWQITRYGSPGDEDGRGRFEERCKIMFDAWGSPEEFREFWQRYIRSATFNFHNTNFILDHEQLVETIQDNSVVWWSNVFDYTYSSCIYLHWEVLNAREALIQGLGKKRQVTIYERWPQFISGKT